MKENAILAQVQQLPTAGEIHGKMSDHDREELRRRMCECLGVDPRAMAKLAYWVERCERLESELAEAKKGGGSCNTCQEVDRRCDSLWEIVRRNCCPGNILYSQITLDEYSDNAQVNLDQPVAGLPAPFVASFPVAPTQAIRLEQLARPGYLPQKIAIDLALANNGTNYLDISIQLYLGPGGTTTGKPIGPLFRGNEFLNKDGSQIHIEFPKYRGRTVEVGSLEKMAVEIRHTGGANDILSASVRLPYDEAQWYEYCSKLGLCVPGYRPSSVC